LLSAIPFSFGILQGTGWFAAPSTPMTRIKIVFIEVDVHEKMPALSGIF